MPLAGSTSVLPFAGSISPAGSPSVLTVCKIHVSYAMVQLQQMKLTLSPFNLFFDTYGRMNAYQTSSEFWQINLFYNDMDQIHKKEKKGQWRKKEKF